jgi:hypothetical protein
MRHSLPPAYQTRAKPDLQAQNSYGIHQPYRPAYPPARHAPNPILSQLSPTSSPSPTHLAIQYKLRQLPPINPMQPPNHRQTTRNPPTITDVLQLLRPPIQPTALRLPLTQPHPQLILIHGIQSPRNRQRRATSKDLPRMRFCPRSNTISAIEVRTRDNVVDCLPHIHQIHQL